MYILCVRFRAHKMWYLFFLRLPFFQGSYYLSNQTVQKLLA